MADMAGKSVTSIDCPIDRQNSAPSNAQKEKYFPANAIMWRKSTQNTVFWLITVPAETIFVAFSALEHLLTVQQNNYHCCSRGGVVEAHLCSVLACSRHSWKRGFALQEREYRSGRLNLAFIQGRETLVVNLGHRLSSETPSALRRKATRTRTRRASDENA